MDRPEVASRSAAAAVFVDLLRESDSPLDARGLKQRLVARGVTAEAADQAWRRAQPVLRRHPDITFDEVRGAYRYGGAGRGVPVLTAEEALDRLLPPKMTGRKAELAASVRSALKERDDLEARLRAGYVGGRDLRAARERQMRIDAMRALADVVAEVEEMAAAAAPAEVTVERVRALAATLGLRPIGRAGEQTTFHPGWHSPIGSRPSDDEWVTIVRPGYTWHDGGEVVLIAKAQVVAAPRARARQYT